MAKSMETADWLALIEGLEEATRSGRSKTVQDFFRNRKLTEIPREFKYRLAELARRNSAPMTALQILNPHVRGKLSELESATSQEMIVYANSLLKMECSHEALALLHSIKNPKDLMFDLYIALALHGQWDYKKSVLYLKRFIAQPGITAYQRLIGRVNLLASYVFLRDYQAAQLLCNFLISELSRAKHHLLLGNVYELQSQIYIFQKKFDLARQSLFMARSFLEPTGGVYFLFVKKWEFILDMLEESSSTRSCEQRLQQLKQEAIHLRLGETVRDLDFFFALSSKDLVKIQQIMDGTSREQYKKRAFYFCEIFLGIKISGSIKNPVRSVLQSPKNHSGPQIEIADDIFLKLGKRPTLLKTFQILLKDRYQPTSLGTLYRSLYPGSLFEPFLGFRRIGSLIGKLNSFLSDEGLPIKVKSKNFEYSLEVGETCSSVCYNGIWHQENYLLKLILCRFNGKSFDAEKVMATTGLSRQQAYRLLRDYQKQNLILRKGSTKEYYFSNRRKSIRLEFEDIAKASA